MQNAPTNDPSNCVKKTLLMEKTATSMQNTHASVLVITISEQILSPCEKDSRTQPTHRLRMSVNLGRHSQLIRFPIAPEHGLTSRQNSETEDHTATHPRVTQTTTGAESHLDLFGVAANSKRLFRSVGVHSILYDHHFGAALVL